MKKTPQTPPCPAPTSWSEGLEAAPQQSVEGSDELRGVGVNLFLGGGQDECGGAVVLQGTYSELFALLQLHVSPEERSKVTTDVKTSSMVSSTVHVTCTEPPQGSDPVRGQRSSSAARTGTQPSFTFKNFTIILKFPLRDDSFCSQLGSDPTGRRLGTGPGCPQ